jgi:hypothetical protein
MKSRRCLRIALVLGGLVAGWQPLAPDADASLLGLFCHHRRCADPVCCEVYTCCDPCACCDPCCCGGYVDCGCSVCCEDYGCRRGRRARRAARRMRRCCSRTVCSSPCGTCGPAYCGGYDAGCGSWCGPSHVGCGRRARRCQRRAMRMCRRSCSYACCEPCVSTGGGCCAESCTPYHAGCGRRMRMRGCGRVRNRHARCAPMTCAYGPSHGGCDVGGGYGRLRGRRHCHYSANHAYGYGCSHDAGDYGCPHCGPSGAAEGHFPVMTHPAVPQPADKSVEPTPADKTESLPKPPQEGSTAYRLRSRL